MDKKDLVKGKWYLLSSNFYIKFGHLDKRGDIYVTEYITSTGKYYNAKGPTGAHPIREANAEDYLKHPEMGVYAVSLNYEIF